MSKRFRILLAVFGVVIVAVALFIARPRVSATSIQIFPETDCACSDYDEDMSGVIFLNPLRDRSPESAADVFLRELANQKCSPTIDSGLCRYALEQARPVVDWKLVNRRDQGKRVSLFYHLKDKVENGAGVNSQDLWGQGMVEVDSTNGQWKVASFGAVY